MILTTHRYVYSMKSLGVKKLCVFEATSAILNVREREGERGRKALWAFRVKANIMQKIIQKLHLHTNLR